MQEKTCFNAAPARGKLMEILDRVIDGEHITISRYNIPVAVMVPIKDAALIMQVKSRAFGKEREKRRNESKAEKRIGS